MPGHFYTPPPSFVGGQQPYAPHLGIPRSGPVPDNPPPINRAYLRIVDTVWKHDPVTVIYITAIAAHADAPVAPDNPPPSSYALRYKVVELWQPPYFPPPKGSRFSPLIPTPDTTPDQFTFTDQSGVALSSTITSDPVTITGIDAAADITVSGGTYSINGGAFTASAGTVVSGDQVRARHTSSGSYSTAVNTIVTISGVSDTFTSTTTNGFPVLLGSIPNQSAAFDSGTHQFDLSGYFSGADSYAISPAVEAGWSFDTNTGILEIDTDVEDTFGPYTVTATNANGDTESNAFTVKVSVSTIRPYRGLRGRGIRKYT